MAMRTSISSLIASVRSQGTLIADGTAAASSGVCKATSAIQQALGSHQSSWQDAWPETWQLSKPWDEARSYTSQVAHPAQASLPHPAALTAASLGTSTSLPAACQHQTLDQHEQHVGVQGLGGTGQTTAHQVDLALSIIRDLAKQARTGDTASFTSAGQGSHLQAVLQATWPTVQAAIQEHAPIRHAAELIYSLGCLHEKGMVSATCMHQIKAGMDQLVDHVLRGAPGLPNLSRSYLGLSRLGFTSTSASSRRLAAACVAASQQLQDQALVMSDREREAAETGAQNLLRTAARLSLPTTHPLVHHLAELVTALASRSPPSATGSATFAPTVMRSLAVLGWRDPAPYTALAHRALSHLPYMQPQHVQMLEAALQASLKQVSTARPGKSKAAFSGSTAAGGGGGGARQALAAALSTVRAVRRARMDQHGAGFAGSSDDADWWGAPGRGMDAVADSGLVQGAVEDVIMKLHNKDFKSQRFAAAVEGLREALQLGPIAPDSAIQLMHVLALEGAVGTGPERADLLDIGQKPPGPQLLLSLEQHVLQHVNDYPPADVSALVQAAVQSGASSSQYKAEMVKQVVQVVEQLPGDQLARLVHVLSQQQAYGREAVYAAVCHRIVYEAAGSNTSSSDSGSLSAAEAVRGAAPSSHTPHHTALASTLYYTGLAPASHQPVQNSNGHPSLPVAPPQQASEPHFAGASSVTEASREDMCVFAAPEAVDVAGAASNPALDTELTPSGNSGHTCSNSGTAATTTIDEAGPGPAQQPAASMELCWQQVGSDRQLVTDGRRSLVVLGVPPNIKLQDFKQLIDQGAGCEGRYDFLHMPYTRGKNRVDPSTGTTGWFAGKRGYAFINTADAAAVQAVAKHLDGRQVTVDHVSKVLQVRYAQHQGLQALLSACKIKISPYSKEAQAHAESKGPYILPLKPIKPMPTFTHASVQPSFHHSSPVSSTQPPASGQPAPVESLQGYSSFGSQQSVLMKVSPTHSQQACDLTPDSVSAFPSTASNASNSVHQAVSQQCLAGLLPRAVPLQGHRGLHPVSQKNLAWIANSLAADGFLDAPFFSHLQTVLAAELQATQHMPAPTAVHQPAHVAPARNAAAPAHLCQPYGARNQQPVQGGGGMGSGTTRYWSTSSLTGGDNQAVPVDHHVTAGVDHVGDHVPQMLAALCKYAAKCQQQWRQQATYTTASPTRSTQLPTPMWATCSGPARDPTSSLVDPLVLCQALQATAHVVEAAAGGLNTDELSVDRLKKLVGASVSVLTDLLDACEIYEAVINTDRASISAGSMNELMQPVQPWYGLGSTHSTAPAAHQPIMQPIPGSVTDQLRKRQKQLGSGTWAAPGTDTAADDSSGARSSAWRAAPPLKMGTAGLKQESKVLCEALGRLLQHGSVLSRLGLSPCVVDAVWVLARLGHTHLTSFDQLGELLISRQAHADAAAAGSSATAHSQHTSLSHGQAFNAATEAGAAGRSSHSSNHHHHPAVRSHRLLNPSQLSRLVWTLGSHVQHMQWRRPEVAAILASQAVHQLHHMTGPQATTTLWGLSELGAASESVIQTFLGHLSHCYDLHHQHLITLHHVLHVREQQAIVEEPQAMADVIHQGMALGMSVFLKQLLDNAAGVALGSGKASQPTPVAFESKHLMAPPDNARSHEMDAGSGENSGEIRTGSQEASKSTDDVPAAVFGFAAAPVHGAGTVQVDSAQLAEPIGLSADDVALLQLLQRLQWVGIEGANSVGARHQRLMEVVDSVQSLVAGTLVHKPVQQRQASWSATP